MQTSLYNNNELEQAFDLLEETGEALPALSIEQDFLHAKSITFAQYHRQLSADETIIDEEIKRLQSLKKRVQGRIEFVENTISDAMQIAGIEKIETPTVKLFFRSSASVQITEEWLISSEFIEVKTSVNRAEIRKRLLKGEQIEGAKLEHKLNLQVK